MESEDKKPIFTKRLILIILAVILLILIIFLLLRKCGGGGSNYQVQSITLSPTSVGIDKGQNYPIYAYVLPDDAKDKSLIWSSSDENVATVDAAGLVTGINEGTATITATAGDGSGVTGQCVVTVGSALPNLEQIQLNKSTYSVRVGKSVLVEVTPIPSTAQLTDIQYSIADTSVATVDMYGTIKGVKKGTTVLTVKANNGGVTATATVNVTKSSGGSGGTSGGNNGGTSTPTEVAVTGINLPSDGCYKLRVGNEYTLTASLVPVNATNQELKWESSDTSIATVTATGKVIASTKQGTVTIKATAKSGVYSTYEIRVVSKSSKEGSCSSSSNNGGGGSSGNGGSTGGGNEVTTPNVGEVTGDGVLTEATAAPVYNNHTYNLTINGYIQSNTIHKGTDGWMQDANCSISINGILPPYYKATYQAPGGSEVEFRTRAYVSNITGPVKVKIYIYNRILANGQPDEDRTQYKEVTVCGKVNGKDIHIDNQAPSCDSITYSGTDLNNSLVVTASDEGGSGLHKVVWENGDTTTFSSDSVTRSITSQFNAGTRKFVATIYDKAGNASSCGINVTDLNGEGSQISGTDLTSTLKSIKLSVSNTTLYPGSTARISVIGTYEDGTTAPINNYIMNESSADNVFDYGSNVLYFRPSDIDSFFGSSNKKEVTFSVILVENGNPIGEPSNSVTITLLKNGKVSCTAKPGNDFEGRNGTWYKGEAGVVCDAEANTDTKITKIGVCFASLNGTCTPSVKSITAATSATAKLGTPTGQGKMCVAYATNQSSSITTECFNNQNFDNTKPTCTVSIDGSVFMYKIDDGNDSSGLDKLTGKNEANLNGEANATTKNFRYTGSNVPKNTDKVTDRVGNSATCSVPTITEAQLDAMQAAAEEEDNNGQVSIQTSDVVGEMWVCSDGTSEIEECTAGYKLNSNASQNFTATFTPMQTSMAMSILGALKKYDDGNVNFEWSSTNKYVVSLSSTTGKTVTGRFVGVGTSKITVCLAGTKNCASTMVTVEPIMISPTKLNAYHSGTMAVGTREKISVSVFPIGALKDVTITSSDSSIVSVESNNVVVARKEGTATITVKSNYNANLVDTINITVTGKDTTKPEVAIRETKVNSTIRVSFTAKDEQQVTLKYGLSEGGSCVPNTTSSMVGRSITETRTITVKGTYTACIEATDASGNKTTTSKTINATDLNESGKIACYVSGATSGTIRVGSAKLATVTCTSDAKINVNGLNFSNSNYVTVSGTKNEITTQDNYRVVINVTIRGAKAGKTTVSLASGSLSTSTSSNSSITIGSYEIIEESTPTLKSSCSISYESSKGRLIATVTAENVQTMDYDTTWGSIGGDKYQKVINDKSGKYSFSAKIYYKDGRSAESISCSYTHEQSEDEAKPIAAPTVSFKCGTTSYNGNDWCNKGVSASISSGPSGSKQYKCTTSGSGSCNPFSGTYSTIMNSGTYTVCAAYKLDDVQGKVGCQTITAKIDTTAPTCTITLGTFTSGTTMNLTAKATETGSGFDTGWTAGWKNQAEGYYTISEAVPGAGETKTITFTLKDKVGNQGTCSIRITGQKQCKSGYSEKSDGYCYMYASAPTAGTWVNVSGSYSPSKGSKTPTRANASSSDKTAYEYYSADVSKCSQYGPYITTCWEERIYQRNDSYCKSGTYKLGNSCYYRTSKITVPKAG